MAQSLQLAGIFLVRRTKCMTNPESCSYFALLRGHRSDTDTIFKSQNLLISNPCLKKNYYVLEASFVAMDMDLTKSSVLHISHF